MFQIKSETCVAGLGEMAKKQPKGGSAEDPQAKPKTKQNTILVYKGSEAVESWLRELAEFSGLPITNTVDLALKQYAERIKFPKAMPKRQAR
jgi:hypothetical protein